ncbi:MAG: PP2C family protein-serine/threonine phosphatase [Thermoanaerobaculia bacterium]
MRGSSPPQSLPSPGFAGRPIRAGGRPGTADILGAHARLAAIDPGAVETPLDQVLTALLVGAGAERGLAVDPLHPGRPALWGISPSDSLAPRLERHFEKEGRLATLLPSCLAEDLLGPAGDPRVIPLTARDETLALVLIDRPPADPVGFASVTAHAASILGLLRMSDRISRTDFELKYRVWELQSVYDVGLSIAGTLDLDSLADDILVKSISLLNARNGTLVVRTGLSEEGGVLVKSFGAPLAGPEALAAIPGSTIRWNRGDERSGFLAEAPAETLLLSPIVADGRPLGLLVVADKENRAGGVDDFTAGDERILSLFGNQAAIALENARLHREAVEKERMEREIELAASIQKTILPDSIPAVPGLMLAGGNRPTRQVGGDYFDVFPLPDGRTAFCVADVAGKGVPAALLVSTVHAGLRILLDTGLVDLPDLVGRLQRHLLGYRSTRKFVTLFLALFDPSSGTVRYVNAGHNPGIRLASGATSLLPSSGPPIGILPHAVHREASVTLVPGDTLVLYSDGITEAVNTSDEEFGMDRLVALIRGAEHESPEILSGQIFEAVSDFTRGVAQYDDQTVLVARAC